MVTQTTFKIQKGTIIGIQTTTKTIIQSRQYNEKNCKWCNKKYTPTSAHQLYCSTTCRQYSDQEHTKKRVRNYRQKYKDVLCLIRVVTLGTGNLGPHMSQDITEEYNKIQKELRRTGIRTSSQSTPFHHLPI